MSAKTPLAPRSVARLIIVDDHELARAGLRSMLAGDPGLEIVGEGSNGHEGLALCRKFRPDLALLDVRMPEMDGIETTRQIKRESPNTCVLIITTHETPDYVLAALEAGAAGYLLKDVTRPDLLSTISRVLRGESILGAEMAVRMMQRLAQSKGHAEGPSVERLTPREQEVLQFVVEGQTNREIAARMSLSVGTIKIHVEHIIGKLGVSDRTQAAVHAVRYGLVHGGPGDKR